MNDLLDQVQCDEQEGPTVDDWMEFAEVSEELDRREAERDEQRAANDAYFVNLEK